MRRGSGRMGRGRSSRSRRRTRGRSPREKLTRVIRIVRVIRIFRELRIIVLSIATTLRSLFWTLVLLFLLMYIFGVYLCRAIAMHRAQDGTAGNVTLHFNNVPQMLLTMFQLVTNGLAWSELTVGLADVSLMSQFVVVVYIAFVLFAVSNVVTGLFVDRALKSADLDLQHVIDEEMAKRNRVVDNLSKIFHDADEDGSGTLTWDELQHHFQQTKVQAYFKTLHLEMHDIKAFFELVWSNEIDIDQFAHTCWRLKGPAKNIDLVVVRHQQEMILKKLANAGVAGDLQKSLSSTSRSLFESDFD